MKRIFALLLCLVLLLGCFSGCSSKKEETVLKVGYGRASLVPEHSMPLQGYPGADSRWFDTVLDPIYATAIAFQDQDNNTVILIQYDLSDCNHLGIIQGINDLTEEFGLPKENIVISATHTHSAPVNGQTASMDDYLVTYWRKLLRQQTLAAGTEAMNSLLPAEVFGASTETKNMNFVRHYRMDDGSISGDNFGHQHGSGYTPVKHMRDADPELQLLRFKRQGGKDVVIANFQTHPHRAGGGTKRDLTSDFIGPMTEYLEKNLDCHFAYFSGGSGDVDPSSRILNENITLNHVEQGEALGQYAEIAFSQMKKMDASAVKFLETTCTVECITGGTKSIDRRITVFSIGDVAFVNNDYEMFNAHGKYIKDNSPFEMTFVTTIGKSSTCYIPDAATFAYEGIDSYEETMCTHPAGTGELLAEAFVSALKQIHPGEK